MKQGELTFLFQAKKHLIGSVFEEDVYYSLDGSEYGIAMGEGFIDALQAPLTLKDMITNEARGENGTRILVNTNIAARNVNLKFNIHGVRESISPAYYNTRVSFFQRLLRGSVFFLITENGDQYVITKTSPYIDIKVKDTSVHRLVYTGKSAEYRHSYNGVFGVVAAQFYEPNPLGTINASTGESTNIHIGTI